MSRFRHAVLGQPVVHSRSPQIHAAFAAQFGLAIDYERIEVAPEALPARLAELHDAGYHGLNLTVPHKTEALALCVSLSEAAHRAAAVNTLIRADAGWVGDNTDGEGLVRDLQCGGVELAGRRVLVLGAGGAARGIAPALLSRRPAELVISSRNPWKPEALVERLAPLGPYRPCTHHALKGDRFDLVINATSIGHQGRFLRLPDGLLAEGAVACDLNYGPAHRPFADWARAQGAAAVHDGLGMLVEQAALSFERWHGRRPDTAPVRSRLRAESP